MKITNPVCRIPMSALVAVAYAANAVGNPPGDLTKTFDHNLREQISSYDWDAEAPLLKRAVFNVFEANGWNSESDRFAMELVSEIADIPPWKPIQRIELLSEKIADRYDLPDAGAMRIKSRVLVEIGSFFGKNADVIMETAREGMNMRIAGKPFTADQIAKWMEVSRQFRGDSELFVEKLIAEVDAMAGPKGQEVLERDIQAYERRLARFDQMAEVWRKGGWEPSHWGLQHDPIQSGKHPGMKKGNRKKVLQTQANAGPAVPTTWHAHDPETWIAYVREFEKRFQLEPGQVRTAESMHDEMVRRAHAYAETRKNELDEVPQVERDEHPAYASIRDLFAELVERLDAVLTSAQRERADRKDSQTN